MVFELNDTNYSQTIQENDKAIFIDFYSPSCGPCQELLPRLPGLAEIFQEEALICKVDVTHNPKLAQKYEIQSVPFCVAIGRDKILKDYELGAPSMDRLISVVKKAQGKGFFSRLFG